MSPFVARNQRTPPYLDDAYGLIQHGHCTGLSVTGIAATLPGTVLRHAPGILHPA